MSEAEWDDMLGEPEEFPESSANAGGSLDEDDAGESWSDMLAGIERGADGDELLAPTGEAGTDDELELFTPTREADLEEPATVKRAKRRAPPAEEVDEPPAEEVDTAESAYITLPELAASPRSGPAATYAQLPELGAGGALPALDSQRVLWPNCAGEGLHLYHYRDASGKGHVNFLPRDARRALARFPPYGARIFRALYQYLRAHSAQLSARVLSPRAPAAPLPAAPCAEVETIVRQIVDAA